MAETEKNRLITRSELAKLWHVSGRTIDRMRQNGQIPWYDLTGGQGGKPIVRFSLSDVWAYEERFRMSISGATIRQGC